MTTTFLLVRHGETAWNAQGRMMGVSDIPLTTKGKQQARAVGLLLKKYPIDVIYSSPLRRTVQTARAIHAFHKHVPFLLHDALKERNFGSLEGKTYEEVNKVGAPMVYSTAWYYLEYQPPGGERLRDVIGRAQSFIQNVSKDSEGKTVVVVSHGTFQRAFICALLGIQLHELFDVRFDNTSISIVEYHRSTKGTLHLVNYTTHTEHLL